MDPKQEAQRIFNRFYDETLTHLSDHNTKEDARKSALICVDEIIKLLNIIDQEYWFCVKQEINKL